MPWKCVGNKIVKSDTGEVVGHSKDHKTCEAAVRARYANAHLSGEHMKKKYKKRTK